MAGWSSRRFVVGGKGKNSLPTISRALRRLRPGDTLELSPGIYRESIVIPCDNVSLVAEKPGVVLDGSLSLEPAAFKHVRNRAGVFYWPLPEGSSTVIPWIFLDDQMLVCRLEPLETDSDRMCFHVDMKRRRLEVNINGRGIPAGARITVPVIGPLIDLNKRSDVSIRGLELTMSAGDAVEAAGSQRPRIEYCLIRRAGGTGIHGGHKALYARNTITLCNGNAIWQGDGDDESLIEENLVVANAVTWDPVERWSGNLKQNGASRCVYRHNWIMDHIAGPVKAGPQTRNFSHCFATGIWPDINCNNNAYIGNACARLPHAGLYVEHTADGNIAAYNCVQDCAMGITLRQASQNLVARNWIFNREFFGWGQNQVSRYAAFGRGFDADGKPVTQAEESAMWGRQLFEGLCVWHAYDDFQEASSYNSLQANLVQVSGRAVSVPLHKYSWPDADARRQTPPVRVLTNRLDGNYYDRPETDNDFALLGQKQMPDFESYRRETDWDRNARCGRFSPEVIGMEPIWTLPWAALQVEVPVAILHDPSLQTRSATSIDEPLFWHGSHPEHDWVNTAPQSRWDRNEPKGHSGRGLMFLESTRNHRGRPFVETIRWTSAAIPVKPATSMGVDLWMKADGVKPVKKGSGVRISVCFRDACGFPVGEKTFVDKENRKNLTAGTFTWTRITDCAKVPRGACWMIVVMSLSPAEGKVCFDDIRMGLVDPLPPDPSGSRKARDT